jgi:hypothetical protein
MGMTNNKDNEPIDPDELELDDMLLDLAAQGGDPIMKAALEGIAPDVIKKNADKIEKILKARGKKK